MSSAVGALSAEKRRERRQHARSQVQVPVVVKVRGKTLDGTAQSLNLGGGGMLLLTHSRIEPGADIEIVLMIGAETFSCQGTILRSERGEGGTYRIAAQIHRFAAVPLF